MTKAPHSESEFPKFPDFSQFYADYGRLFGDFGKFFMNGKAPAVDFDALMSSQRKNLEAIAAANRVAFQGCQAALQRHAEIVREFADEFVAANKVLVGAGSPEDKFAKQTSLCKQAFEGTVSNVREIANLLQKSGNEAADLLSRRVVENFDEAQAVFATPAKKAAA